MVWFYAEEQSSAQRGQYAEPLQRKFSSAQPGHYAYKHLFFICCLFVYFSFFLFPFLLFKVFIAPRLSHYDLENDSKDFDAVFCLKISMKSYEGENSQYQWETSTVPEDTDQYFLVESFPSILLRRVVLYAKQSVLLGLLNYLFAFHIFYSLSDHFSPFILFLLFSRLFLVSAMRR